MQIELENYVAESLKMRNDGPYQYAQYIHGGVIPTLESQRANGELEKGKIIESS